MLPATDDPVRDPDPDTTAEVEPDWCEERPPLARDTTFEGETAQADIEAFCAIYSGVTPGRVLTVRGTDLTDLDALDCVCTVGALVVQDNPALVDLTWPRLRDAGTMTLSENPSLQRLRLPDLQRVDVLSISKARIDNLDVGQATGGRLELSQALVDPAPDAPVPGGSNFVEINVSANPSLTTLAGLPCQDGGALRAWNNASLTRPDLPACTQALDELNINTALSDLAPLRRVSVSRRLALFLGPELTTLDGLQGTSRTLITLDLIGGAAVDDVEALSHVKQISGLSVDGLGAAEPPFDLSILPLDGLMLRNVGMERAPWQEAQRNATQVRLTGVPWADLGALDGMIAASELYLRDMPIRDLDALDDLERLRGDLTLEDLPELADVSALHGLELGGELNIRDCPKLSDEAIATWRATLR